MDETDAINQPLDRTTHLSTSTLGLVGIAIFLSAISFVFGMQYQKMLSKQQDKPPQQHIETTEVEDVNPTSVPPTNVPLTAVPTESVQEEFNNNLSCTTDADCPPTSSCINPAENCWVYQCIQSQCILKDTAQ